MLAQEACGSAGPCPDGLRGVGAPGIWRVGQGAARRFDAQTVPPGTVRPSRPHCGVKTPWPPVLPFPCVRLVVSQRAGEVK